MLAKALKRLLLAQCGLLAAFRANSIPAEEPQPAARRSSDLKVDAPPIAANEVDRLLAEEVFQHLPSGQTLAPMTGDETFLRRIYLDLIGEPPLPGEITAFSFDRSPDKRATLAERLLADERFGRNWGRYWRDVILYRRSADQALFASPSLEKYLVERFNRQPRWNEIARSFITAQGEVYDKGETGLFMAHLAEPVEVAAETSRIFLGIQIQCAQCHDHPTDRWKRQQFHELVAFFPRASLRRRMGQPPSFELTSLDSGPRMRRPGMMTGRGSLEHYMPDLKDPSSPGTVVAPVFFVTGQSLETGVTDSARRTALADWMTSADNPWFAKAFVNRIWAEFVGEGFYEPIDDLGPDRHASAPQTLDYLCRQFVAHGYDVKWLMQTITGTTTYQRECRPRRLPDELPFTANVSYRLRADQLFDSLSLAVGVSFDRGGQSAVGPGARFRGGPRAQFARQFGYDPSVRRDEIASTIPQALLMMNSPLINQRNSARQPNSVLAKLLAESHDDEAVAVELYLRCLAREPSDAELAVCQKHVGSTESRSDAFEDIFWSLINSEEFLHRN